MSATASWVTPPVGSVILLANFPGRTNGPHYGLVVGIFKLQGDHQRFLMVAPGTSVKDRHNIDLNTELVLRPSPGGVGSETKFYFNHLMQVVPFPSEDILESNKPRIQPDQITTVVCHVDNLPNRLTQIRACQNGNLINLYKTVLQVYQIDIDNLADISSKNPKIFLS